MFTITIVMPSFKRVPIFRGRNENLVNCHIQVVVVIISHCHKFDANQMLS